MASLKLVGGCDSAAFDARSVFLNNPSQRTSEENVQFSPFARGPIEAVFQAQNKCGG